MRIDINDLEPCDWCKIDNWEWADGSNIETSLLKVDGIKTVMILAEGEKVGYVSLVVFRDVITIHRIWIEPASRRQGIASSVLISLILRVQQMIQKNVLLRTIVAKNNQLGRKLFVHFGLCGRHWVDIRGRKWVEFVGTVIDDSKNCKGK